jgi:hypothetical protein
LFDFCPQGSCFNASRTCAKARPGFYNDQGEFAFNDELANMPIIQDEPYAWTARLENVVGLEHQCVLCVLWGDLEIDPLKLLATYVHMDYQPLLVQALATSVIWDFSTAQP